MLDFGIAFEHGSPVEVMGTLEYMAPEILSGQAPSPASDLYAVGVMLYQMLLGQSPHKRTSVSRFLAAMLGNTQVERTLTLAGSEPTDPGFSATDPVSRNNVQLAATPGTALGEALPSLSSAEGLGVIEGSLGALLFGLLERDPAYRRHDAAIVLSDLSQIMLEIAGRPLPADTAATRESFLQAAVMIGRAREQATLQAALNRARAGSGSVVLLGGESGVGKSRLLDELRTLALVRGVRVLRGQAVSAGGTAYQVFQDVVRTLVLDQELDDLEIAVLKDLLPELPALLGREVADAPALSPQATQQRLQRELLAVLCWTGEPLLLLLEDIHWSAPESLELLNELLAVVKDRPLLVIASYRNDERPELPQLLPGAEILTLRRLDEEAITALTISMLGDAGRQPELHALLMRETEGNLFTWSVSRRCTRLVCC